MPERGDVLSVCLGNWGFTACRIVAVKVKPVSVLVVGSEYMGVKPPSLDDPKVFAIPKLTHHSFDNEPLAFWTPMLVTPEFEKIGNAEPAEGEDQLAKGKMANWDYILNEDHQAVPLVRPPGCRDDGRYPESVGSKDGSCRGRRRCAGAVSDRKH